MIHHIVFYNSFHLGDLFTTREWVKDIIRQTQNCNHTYAHRHDAKLTHDMCAFHDQSTTLIASLPIFDKFVWDAKSHTLFINTWVGAYHDHFERHPSFLQHHNIILTCYALLRECFQLDLNCNPDPWYYVPRINYTHYDLTCAHRVVLQHTGSKWLFCNNDVKSNQSSMQDMQHMITQLATQNPQITMFVTKQLPIQLPNVLYTSDIFPHMNDLIETSYLSHYCDVIVGKNSGAFTYTQTKNNLQNASKKFVCFSHEQSHVLPHGLNHKCAFVWTNSLDDATCVNLIQDADHA
jgi:hypothetical protein